MLARTPREFLAALMARRTTVEVRAGDTLVTSGGGPRALFLLLRGLAVLEDPVGSTVRVCIYAAAWPSV